MSLKIIVRYFVNYIRAAAVTALDDDGESSHNIHERFTAKDEVIGIIHSLKNVHTDLIKTEVALERFTGLIYM